jgi:hypothetical protein
MGALLSVVLDRRAIVAAAARAMRPPAVAVSARALK